ncbi:multiple epidermal growth factor-like domains protein 10 isoform X2 [Crassostrea angulata]|uniref:multiple epidermal growth factor-like domains protein 10 isoform X2 n=1 Tax=Magallana angulata TaxID=2784310 RepID=UPI0022B15082|nr:multiple epidermal growth factor-like domains protein 10 isoform X2 [Crassostrea angulata]
MPFFIYIETSDGAMCFNNKTGVCCQDYRNVSGKCEACIGSWGIECRFNCPFGHYGFGCRKRCNCSYKQICDPKQGCIGPFEASTAPQSITPNPDLEYFPKIEASLLVVSGILILLLLCTILICNRKLKKQSNPIQKYADGQEVIYDDIRETRMFDNDDASTRVCNLPPSLNGVITPVERDRMTKEPFNQARMPLRRSRMLGPGGYGHWCRGSDNYNHVDFKSVKPLYSYSNIMTNDYDVFESPTSSETQLNDKECDGNKQFEEDIFGNNHRGVVHPIRMNRSMVNRPYSSVKYNRKTRMNEEH